MKTFKFMVILTAVLETILITNMIMFGTKADKIAKEEEKQQYAKLGYYNNQIWTEENRHKNYQKYSAIAGAPMVITNILLLSYFIPNLFKKEKENDPNNSNNNNSNN